MLLILIFCLPLKILVKTEITFSGFETGVYLYGLRVLSVIVNLKEKIFSINKKKKSLVKTFKKMLAFGKKKKGKFTVNPKIITDLGLRFFLNRRGDVDASDWAIQNAMFKSFPESFKISLKRSEEKGLTFSIYGFFTIFQIISKVLANTKRR